MDMDNNDDDGDDDDDDNDTDNDSDEDNDNDSDYDYDCEYDDIKHLFAYFRIETSTEVNLLKLPALGPAANQRSSIGPAANQRGPTAQFTQWSLFGPCSRTCGKSFQSRARRCLARYAFACKGTTVESRECYMRPCPGEQLQE